MISVIVPVYKVEAYLNRCVASIVQQTYQKLEIILVDDGSPDKCGDICDEWVQKDSRIQVIHQKNAGLAAARNVGIDRANGDYLAFIDSDDYIEPDMLEHLFTAMTDAQADMAVCNFTYEFESKEIRDSAWEKLPKNYQFQDIKILSGSEYLRLMNNDLYAVCEVAWNKLYRRECFDVLRYPVGRYHEDEFVICPLVYPLKRIVCIPVVGYHYLQRSTSIMGSGVRYGDILDMLTERCMFYIEKDERDLTERTQIALTQKIKEAGNSIRKEKSINVRKKRFLIAWRLYKKKWIGGWTLVKRFISCLII